MFDYVIFSLTFAAIYSVLALGLNLQWGLTGLFNIGVAGFFAVGAYTAAILTTGGSPNWLGGYDLPFAVGLIGAMVTSGIVALLIGVVTLRLRTDYLAIATIGIAEIVRLLFKNEDWLSNGVRGIPGIDRPFDGSAMSYFLTVVVVVVLVFLAVERLRKSPWGRVLRAVRENEAATLAAGKNIMRFRLEAFVVGSMFMGLGGALYAHFFGFISPEAFDPLLATFLIWVMLIAGGSGNNWGAVAGALVVWFVWSATELVTGMLPPEYVAQAGALRVLLIGVLLQVILLTRPDGLFPESMTRRK